MLSFGFNTFVKPKFSVSSHQLWARYDYPQPIIAAWAYFRTLYSTFRTKFNSLIPSWNIIFERNPKREGESWLIWAHWVRSFGLIYHSLQFNKSIAAQIFINKQFYSLHIICFLDIFRKTMFGAACTDFRSYSADFSQSINLRYLTDTAQLVENISLATISPESTLSKYL